MKKEKYSLCNIDRSYFDFGPCRLWPQIDNDQDASWYGSWCNPHTLEIVEYCEGDITEIKCDTPAEFVVQVISFIEFAGFIGIDPLGDKNRDRLVELGLENYLH